MSDQVPYEPLAEQQTLGSVIMSELAATKLFSEGILIKEDFFLKDHQDVYTTLSEMYQANIPIDVNNLEYHLKQSKLISPTLSKKYLLEIESSPLSPTAISSYSKIVKQNSQRREVMLYVEDLYKKASTTEGTITELFEQISTGAFEILATEKSKSFHNIEEVLENTYEQIAENKAKGTGIGIKTGIQGVDYYLKGLQNKRMYVVAARPGVGKSILGVQLLLSAMEQSKSPSLFFSLEMAGDQVAGRLLSRLTGLEVDSILGGALDEKELQLVKNAGETISKNLYVEDNSNLNTGEMYSIAKKLYLEHGDISMIVVDYIQYIKSTNSGETRQQQISDFSRDLSHMAKELDVPVVVLSQLNRGIDSRQDKKPQLSDLRDSGAIEQDAHSVLMMYYPDENNLNEVDLIVAKNRSGACGECNLLRNGARFTFQDRDVLSLTEKNLEDYEETF